MIAIISFNQFGKFAFDSSCKAVSLDRNDLTEIENLLDSCINDYNKEISKNDRHILSKNYRQYIAATNDKGEMIVWVNCFCETYGVDWKNSIVMVSDGGSCFYRLVINFTRAC